MKKSVIVVIGIIYILAIVVVSFFGLQIETFNEIIYVFLFLIIPIFSIKFVSFKPKKKTIKI